jgi:mannose-1-phosphate guanylyltransferase
LWNSGNFLFRAEVLLAELARFEPDIVTAVEAAVANASTDLGFVRLEAGAFGSAPQKSIDYAVMEKTDRAAVVAGNFRWSDIGSWDAIFDIAERDKSRRRS